ncbi:phosphotransferase [Arthrobacter tumbae]|uniref:phosphotransferase n=1 Tax=Arthrobacter tumbae TaxID=163874 RepID=UPI0019567474|nr:phosphotransferase [Arthrobacter tumbae]MBM7781854.1 Ser/Thr protein kinase RdoA (MazF antagonist) [Arthrobacter tumbae]
MNDEEQLTGGNTSDSVVRVGKTVRKPWQRKSAVVQSYLQSLRGAGVVAPKPLGRDSDNRHVVEYVAGDLALNHLPLSTDALFRIGRMVRQIHDASETFPLPQRDDWNLPLPAEAPNLMCHNDLAPWNLIVGERWVFIDWDGAGPSTRLWDLAYAAQSFSSMFEGQPVEEAAVNLKAFVDGYGADIELRRALPDAMSQRTQAMYDLLEESHRTGFQPWASMYVDGHGEHWRDASAYVQQNHAAWEQALSI